MRETQAWLNWIEYLTTNQAVVGSNPTACINRIWRKSFFLSLIHIYVNGEIYEALKGQSPFNQAKLDHLMIELDGTKNKSRLGANAILGVSMAISRAAANSEKIPLYRYLGGVDLELPQPFFNVINGGVHADSGIDVQEFLITPVKRESFRDGLEKIANIYHTLKKILADKGLETAVGDEGGFALSLIHILKKVCQ